MAYQLVGYTLSFQSSNGVQNVLGQSGDFEGPIEILVRANDPGVFLCASYAVNLPGQGYELVPDVEYRFTMLLAQLFAATTSATPVTLSVLRYPKIGS